MKTKKFTIAKDGGKFAKGIRYGNQWVLHLIEGTVLNEHYIKWIINCLNGKKCNIPEKLDVFKTPKL